MSDFSMKINGKQKTFLLKYWPLLATHQLVSTSLQESKCCSANSCLIDGNTQKLKVAKSGEYGKWSSSQQLKTFIVLCTGFVLRAGELSLCIIILPRLEAHYDRLLLVAICINESSRCIVLNRSGFAADFVSFTRLIRDFFHLGL